MDWNAAIERNGRALKRILAMLVAMAGGEATLPRHLHRAILRLLRPAEAAARRLVIVAARDLAATPQARKEEIMTQPRPRKARPKSGSIFVHNGKGTGIVLPSGVRPGAVLPGLATPRPAPRRLALPLLDPLRGLAHHRRPLGCVPRVSAPGISDRGSDAARHCPTIRSTRRVLPCVSGRLAARWTICRRMPGVSPAGAAASVAQNKNRNAGLLRRRLAAASRPSARHAAAAGHLMKSTKSSPISTTSPSRRWSERDTS